MALFASRNYPWKLTKGYETVDTFQILSHPITSQSLNPCYIPDNMRTTPLRFPSVITGSDRHPIHVARSTLQLKYTSNKYLENQKNLVDQVSSVITDSQVIRETLDKMVSLVKEKVNTCNETENNTKKTQDIDINYLKLKLDKLCLKLEDIIIQNKKIQGWKRKLQACIQNIDFPLYISAECLYHRQSRSKTELINDKVEQMLMKESAEFKQRQQNLQKYLEQCENQINKKRIIQYELENLIKNIKWFVFVDKTEEELKKFLESELWVEKSENLLKRSALIISESLNLQRKIKIDMDDLIQDINKIWNETNNAFAERNNQIRQAKEEIECLLSKVNNEIFHVEKNLKYLKNDKRFPNYLQEGKEQLESLYKTKRNLEMELSLKIKSLFIDDQKCMTVRKCYPISAIISH